MSEGLSILKKEAINILRELISLDSFSKEEWKTASALSKYMALLGLETGRVKNNVYAKNKFYDPSKPTILLNSHHDTVKPNAAYTKDPFTPVVEDGKVYGLGSNDAGGALVALLTVFIYYYNRQDLNFNLVFAATAEEEISGKDGIESVLQYLPQIDCALVGEPTNMQMAVAERGLMVLDCVALGIAGHAARNEGENAVYKAITDIEWFKNYSFQKVSDLLGEVKMTVTSFETENKAHNVVPSSCRFVVDVRVNELYTLDEILKEIKSNVKSDVEPRSTRLKSSAIALDHPLVKAGLSLGLKPYGSPTTSDKSLMPFPALKIGPGDSARSHTADEFIFIKDIEEAIDVYIELLNKVQFD
jgi:acetylornithine deacetylase